MVCERRKPSELAQYECRPDFVSGGPLRCWPAAGAPRVPATASCTASSATRVKALARLVASGEVIRPARGRYAAARPADPERPRVPGGVSARTVVTMLVVLSSALDDAMAQGLVARNVARLIKRPDHRRRDGDVDTGAAPRRSAAHISSDRLAACWLLTLARLRRSEVLGLRWTDVDLDAGKITVAQGRVVVGGGTVTGAPKSTRSARTLPMPPDVLAALRAFKTRQAEEHLALGGRWPDTGLVGFNADDSPSGPRRTPRRSPPTARRRGCR